MPQNLLASVMPDNDAPSNFARSTTAEARGTYADPEWVEVLVDCPGVQGLFTYRTGSVQVQPGDILSVPFGAQQVGAIAIRLIPQPPPDLDLSSIRQVEEVVSPGFFPPTYWTLLHQVADYYCATLMQVVRVALPPGLLGRSQRRIRLTDLAKSLFSSTADPTAVLDPAAMQVLGKLQAQKDGDYTWQYLQRQIRGANRGLQQLLQLGWVESYLEPPTGVRPKRQQAVVLTANPPDVSLSLRQQEIVDVLKRRGGDLWLQELLQLCHTSSSVLKALAQKGVVVIQPREVLRSETGQSPQSDLPKQLTTAQAEALAAIASLQGYVQVLLHGVTGSGKTEVYLQAIAPILQQGKSALVLVPEIGLTPQLTDRFRARFGAKVRVYHSALSDGERYDTWRQMLSGAPQVIIGTRSAVFAPLPHLGLILLDEEHDGSFKQDQPAPCYHARTVAQWRAKLEDCPLILGSATPSLETWVSSRVNPEKPISSSLAPLPLYLSLPNRIQARPMPPIEVVDMRRELKQGNRSIFSQSLQDALKQLQAQGRQGLLFIHRRGHSTFVSCRSCGYVLECPHCDVSLAYHQTQADATSWLRCHYCGYGRSQPSHCPECDSPYLKHFGSGTQRVMQELSRQFPQLRCIRFDSDTTRTKGAHRTLLTQFAQGEADLLVGTQMLTKGIDLPQVTLVGVIAADGLLHLADYRAGERAFQTLIQVAGRAGRGNEPGKVILQTYSPQHPVIEAVRRHDYEPFVATELQQRRSLNYPPYGQLLLLRLSSPDATAVRQTAEKLASQLRPLCDRTHCELLGPAPAAIPRIARRYRWQILIKCPPGSILNRPALIELRSHCPAQVSLTLDVDPLSLL
ncbi:primosomal protein N' [Oculatella sp. FACHB-28]|uniref:primosomal protein N' n=1 Tax=Oculatella sp. FACHB-28 TaxID=2692845 RepID=UPI001F54F994|nr:primosomal protein N' [Oculatella sp. FACHB-28]